MIEENLYKMVKTRREPITPRRRASLAKSGNIGKVTKVLPRPVSSTTPCVAQSANIRVVVRVRPTNAKEQGDNFRTVIKVMDDQMLIFDPKEEEQPFFYHGVQQKTQDILKKSNKDITFMFDKVFNINSTNLEVFTNSTKSLINRLMDGCNCSVFAYGATGAGKTYTMIGSAESPGITYLTMKDLFNRKEELSSEREFEIMLTYIEVYNELVKDLLNPGPALNLREDAKYGVMIPGVKGYKINNPEELFSLLEQGNRRRTQHPTDANAESSRSHAVFQVYLQMTMKCTREVRRAKFSMIDLAGSERGSATGFVGARFKEGANINKSLLALGNCINSLADGHRHVPYRDSKLTRLLKDSLGGNCHTVMIANVSPSSLSFDDTYNTLKYATRAKKIKSNIKRNIVNVDMHIDQYIKLVEDLQSENSTLKTDNNKLKKECEQLRQEISELSSPKLNIQADPTTQIDCSVLSKEIELLRKENEDFKQQVEMLGNTVETLGMRKESEEHLQNVALKKQIELLNRTIAFYKTKQEKSTENETPKKQASTILTPSLNSKLLAKLIDEKKEMMLRAFQLQSSELGMSLRRQLKTDTKNRLSNCYINTPDKDECQKKLKDQVERFEKKEKATTDKIDEIKQVISNMDQKIQELLEHAPDLSEEFQKHKNDIDSLEYNQKFELMRKELDIWMDDHKDKCLLIEKMSTLLKRLFLALGGTVDAPKCITTEYENLVACFQGHKNLKWQENGAALPSDSGVSSSTSLHDNLEEPNRATKRKIEAGSEISLDSTFTLDAAPGTSKASDSGKLKVNNQIVAKGFKAPAPKRLANAVSPRYRKSPGLKENWQQVRKVPLRPDTAKALLNVRKNTQKSLADRPRFRS